MPEKVTKEEKLVEVAIMKAKEVLAEFQHGTTVANDADTMGETVKAKRPTKNPKEEKIANPTGDEGYGYVGKAQKIIDSINAVFDALKKYDYTEEDQLRDYVADLNARLKNLTTKLENREIKEEGFEREASEIIDRLKQLKDVSGLSGHAMN
jgi:hypothetical protein